MMLLSLIVLVLLLQSQALAEPEFNETFYSTSFPETDSSLYDIPELGFITVACTGAPTDNITYSLQGVSDDIFTINSHGQLSVERELDYDNGDVFFQFSVVCRDDGGYDTAMISITVSPVNEHTPTIMVTPTPLSGFLQGDETNMVVGRVLVSQVPNEGDLLATVVDEDAGQDGRVTFELDVKNNVEEILSIDPETGTIVIANNPDADVNENGQLFFGFAFTACDQGGHCATSNNIQILVLEAADEEPIFEEPLYQRSLKEGTGPPTTIVTANCTDRDVREGKFQEISFVNISSEISSLLSLNNETGEIALRKQLDYERVQHIELKLKCLDTAGFQAITNFSLDVEPINDELPYFGQSKSYLFSLPSTSAVNYLVGTIDAYDNDLGIGGSLTYYIEDNPFYSIDNQSGNIILLQNANNINESIQIYNVVVSDEIHNSSTEVVLQITHVTSTGFLQTTLGISVIAIATGVMLVLVISIPLLLCYCFRHRKAKTAESPLQQDNTHIYDTIKRTNNQEDAIYLSPNPGYTSSSPGRLCQTASDYAEIIPVPMDKPA